MTEPLVDKTAIGSTWVRLGVSIGTSATAVAIQLPRKPSFFWYTTTSGAVVYQTSSDLAASTSLSFVCRATAACVANLVVM